MILFTPDDDLLSICIELVCTNIYLSMQWQGGG
jgi:hypothetical protein